MPVQQYIPFDRLPSNPFECEKCGKTFRSTHGLHIHQKIHRDGYDTSARKIALANGDKYYFTGIPCKRFGHIDWRRSSNGACRSCEIEKGRAYCRKNRESCARYSRQWYADNKERSKAKTRKYAKEHPERIQAIVRRTKEKNRAKQLERQKRYKRENPAKVAAQGANRRASKRQAMPQWVNKAEILTIYANRPDGYQVDHIVPLKSPVVCGLHVPWNLQYLTAEENNRKHNRLTADVAYAARSAVEMNR